MVRYQDWTGERKQKCKRGFATKREAQEWERSFQMQTSGDLDMTFEAFTELYTKDMKPRLKENTWLTKENIIQKKILPQLLFRPQVMARDHFTQRRQSVDGAHRRPAMSWAMRRAAITLAASATPLPAMSNAVP